MKFILIMVGCVLVGAIVPAQAYLDPGATSIVLQWLIAGVAASATVFSIFFHRIKMLLMKLFRITKSK